ncbi:MAG: BatD family protein [Polyangiaceae bacterium]
MNLKHRWLARSLAMAVSTLPVMFASTHSDRFELGETALAQPAQQPQIAFRLDNEDVEAGEAAQVSLTVMWAQGTAPATDPKLTTPRGLSVSGPILTSKQHTSWVNGQVSSRTGFTATWRIPTSKEGAIDVGPAQVTWNGQKLTTNSLRIAVHAPGTRPKAFDPFGGLFPRFGSLDDDLPRPAEREAPVDPKFSLSEPLEPTAFLRPMLNKTQAVVGELVILSVYLYTQPSRAQMADPHEPSAPDFFQRSISSARDAGPRRVSINGTSWNVELIRRVAFFPLKPGHLSIGPMSVTLLGRGFRGTGVQGGLVRSSAPVTVDVTEPPAAGRPQGYVLGDVGEYSLSASVEPRTVNAGGSISVTAVLRGQGNIPSSLRTPEQKGVTWLEPEVREAIEAHDEEVSGSRTFTYVVKLEQPGSVDLGELALPYWSATRQKYEVAKVKLGKVDVTGVAPAPVASAAPDPFAALPPMRVSASAYTPAKAPLGEKPWFWGLLLGGPLLVLAFDAATRASKLIRERSSQNKETPAAIAMTSLDEAQARLKSNDARSAIGMLERAVFSAVEARTGVKLRGLLRTEMKPAMKKAGIDDDLANEIERMLERTDGWRFQSTDGPSLDDVKSTRDLVARIGKVRR